MKTEYVKLIAELRLVREEEHALSMTAQNREYHAGRRDAYESVITALLHPGTELRR